jgi:chromosome segregation ATPase
MSLLGDIIKAIPHAAHLQDRVREFEAKHAALETENAILKDEKRALNLKIQELEAEVVNLKDEIHELTHTDDLHETEIKILVYLADENTLNFTDSMLINLQLDKTRLSYFLEILRNREYISYFGGSFIGEPIRYYLNQKGREYLITNNLI